MWKINMKTIIEGSLAVKFNQIQLMSKLAILGVPFSKGQDKAGVAEAPHVLRQNGLLKILQKSSQGK